MKTLRVLTRPALSELKAASGDPLLHDGCWYEAEASGGKLVYSLSPGDLTAERWLTCDLLLEGEEQAVFCLYLREQADGPAFELRFGLLNHVQSRLRLPLSAMDLNRWTLEREGGLLKPTTGGSRIIPERVTQVELALIRMGGQPVRWCMTPIAITDVEPPRLDAPLLPKGPLLDEFGQSTTRDWSTRTRSGSELVERLRRQEQEAPGQAWPSSFSRWGGWASRSFEATGFFRTEHDGRRWWLVDPDGHPFWSAGMDCVRPTIDANASGLQTALAQRPDPAAQRPNARGHRCVDYLASNLFRAFGGDWLSAWDRISLAKLRQFGFNTVGNWSDCRAARAMGFPYVVPLPQLASPPTPRVFRDFPDVFDPVWQEEARQFARALETYVGDPALVGYFLMNEPTWGFAQQTPAEGMLWNAPSCHTRRAFADWLRERHGGDAGLQKAWGLRVTLEQVGAGPWSHPLPSAAQTDLETFSTIMVARLFDTLSAACRRIDPHHLNLGARYYTCPPDWCTAGMTSFDVFSINCYRQRPPEEFGRLTEKVGRPLLIGEWHFGALDAGLPASGIGHVRTQADRGKAYRVYLEQAAALPWCVGAHWFTLYDQSALGRFDGENYNIGFLDVCHREYAHLAAAARIAHERMYAVAAGQEEPSVDAPEYLPLLFL